MINLPSGTRIWIACGVTNLRNGFDGLAGLIQTQLSEDPFSGQLFVFRGRRKIGVSPTRAHVRRTVGISIKPDSLTKTRWVPSRATFFLPAAGRCASTA